MNRACAKCAKHDTCFYSSEKVIDCTHHEPKSELNYERLFGTPERAARTLRNIPCGNKPCVDCPIYEPCCGKFSEGHYNPLFEWLRGDAE